MKPKRFLVCFTALFCCLSIHAQSVSEERLTQVLEKFCQLYYQKEFSDKLYQHYTLRIRSVYENNDGTIEVEGTHSYKGKEHLFVRNLHSNVMFKAIVKPLNYEDNAYRVQFDKWYEEDKILDLIPVKKGHWEHSIDYKIYITE